MLSRTQINEVDLTLRTNSLQQEIIPDKCAKTTRISKKGVEVELYPFWLYCIDCKRRKRINPSCGMRNCKRCQFKRARKLEQRYLPRIMAEKTNGGHRWTWVTLTKVDIPVRADTLRADITRYGNLVQRLLAEEYPSGGLLVIEHTVRIVLKAAYSVLSEESGERRIDGPATILHKTKYLKLHSHALVCGGYKDKESFERRYGAAIVNAGLLSQSELDENQGKRHSWMELVRNAKRTLRYMMKYVAKGVELSDEEVELLKRTKYIRTWGFLYRMKEPTFDLVCADCYGKCYVAFDDETCNRFEADNRNDLKVLRLPREIVGPP